MRSTAFVLLIVFTLTSAYPAPALALRQVGLEEGKKADLVAALQPTRPEAWPPVPAGSLQPTLDALRRAAAGLEESSVPGDARSPLVMYLEALRKTLAADRGEASARTLAKLPSPMWYPLVALAVAPGPHQWEDPRAAGRLALLVTWLTVGMLEREGRAPRTGIADGWDTVTTLLRDHGRNGGVLGADRFEEYLRQAVLAWGAPPLPASLAVELETFDPHSDGLLIAITNLAAAGADVLTRTARQALSQNTGDPSLAPVLRELVEDFDALAAHYAELTRQAAVNAHQDDYQPWGLAHHPLESLPRGGASADGSSLAGLEERPKFLIVEDDTMSRWSYEELVKQQYRNAIVETAPTLDKARALWKRKGPFHRVFADGQVEDQWSTDWLRELWAAGALENTRILFMSGSPDAPTRIAELPEALQERMTSLDKPVSDGAIRTALKTFDTAAPLPTSGLEEPAALRALAQLMDGVSAATPENPAILMSSAVTSTLYRRMRQMGELLQSGSGAALRERVMDGRWYLVTNDRPLAILYGRYAFSTTEAAIRALGARPVILLKERRETNLVAAIQQRPAASLVLETSNRAAMDHDQVWAEILDLLRVMAMSPTLPSPQRVVWPGAPSPAARQVVWFLAHPDAPFVEYRRLEVHEFLRRLVARLSGTLPPRESLNELASQTRRQVPGLTVADVASLVQGTGNDPSARVTPAQQLVLVAADLLAAVDAPSVLTSAKLPPDSVLEALHAELDLQHERSEHTVAEGRYVVRADNQAYLTMIENLRRLLGVPAAGLEENGASQAAAGAAAAWPEVLQVIAGQRGAILKHAKTLQALVVSVDESLLAPDSYEGDVMRIAAMKRQLAQWLGLPSAAVDVQIEPPANAPEGALRIMRATETTQTGWAIIVSHLPSRTWFPSDAITLLVVQAFLAPDQPQTIDATPFLTGKVRLETVRRTLEEIFT